MEKPWTMIRVTRDTHAALNRVRASMELADELQTIELRRDRSGHVSLDQVIERLIAAREQHAARRSRANARRRRPATVEAPASDANQVEPILE